MRKFLFAFLFIFSCIYMYSQQTHIYIVRHAEKDLSDKSDPNPNLSEAGKQKADKLLKELKRILSVEK